MAAVAKKSAVKKSSGSKSVKKFLVRGDRSGVHYGEIVSRKGREVQMKNVRRIWYWSGAASLSQMANEGVSRPDDCKFTVYVDSVLVLDAIEILECTPASITCIEGVESWRA